jgi:hypothetical protein
MIIPEIKRVRNFSDFKGKKIDDVVQKGFCLRIIFTDGTFADLDTESSATAKIVLDKGKPRRTRPFH